VKPYLLYFVVLLTGYLPALAQDIASHQWENRVLIVMTTDSTGAEFKRQVEELKGNQEGLTERKLKVYLATPEAYRLLNAPETAWKPGGDLFKNYNKKASEPEVLLIGLDGQIKHRKYSFTTALELFVIIDGMPMRLSEIRNREKGMP